MIVAALVLETATSAWAQQRGSIGGRVLDASGLALPSRDLSPFSSTSLSAPGVDSYPVFSKDRRNDFFVEDQWKVKPSVTLNLGLRYDHQRQTPASRPACAPFIRTSRLRM